MTVLTPLAEAPARLDVVKPSFPQAWEARDGDQVFATWHESGTTGDWDVATARGRWTVEHDKVFGRRRTVTAADGTPAGEIVLHTFGRTELVPTDGPVRLRFAGHGMKPRDYQAQVDGVVLADAGYGHVDVFQGVADEPLADLGLLVAYYLAVTEAGAAGGWAPA